MIQCLVSGCGHGLHRSGVSDAGALCFFGMAEELA